MTRKSKSPRSTEPQTVDTEEEVFSVRTFMRILTELCGDYPEAIDSMMRFRTRHSETQSSLAIAYNVAHNEVRVEITSPDIAPSVTDIVEDMRERLMDAMREHQSCPQQNAPVDNTKAH